MKTCIWCLNPCERYFKEIALACNDMYGQDAEAYRQQMASECDKYLTNGDDSMKDSYHVDSNIEVLINKNIIHCSIDLYAQSNPVCKRAVAGIETCPECGHPMCPICHRHNVTQLSRITGYIGDIGGWNEAKKQELKDRKRYDIDNELKYM